MPTQAARVANLRAIIDLLEHDGLVSRQAQAQFFGDVVTARRLQSMLNGGHIDTLFAAHVEHVLFRPRGWMSEAHEASAPFATRALETDES